MAGAGRAAVAGALAVFCLLTTLLVLWDVVAPPLIEEMAVGRTLAPLDDALARHRSRDPAHRDVVYYVRNGRTAVGRAVIVAAGALLAALAVARRGRVLDAIRAYLGASGPPHNLAVFRIVLFTVFLVDVARTPVVFYSQLPDELLAPPPGLAWFPRLMPMGKEVVETVLLVFRVSCLAAIAGLFTRAATIIALLSGAYANAIAQLSGLLYADHHLLWFAALLAASPCADALSLDAIRRRYGRGAAGGTPPPASRAYALPLRVV